MNKLLKGNNRFARDFNRSVEESNKPEHPLPETIYLYAMKSLPVKRMEELKEHLTYCWDCGEILADAEDLQLISEEVESGNLKSSVQVPNIGELFEKAFGRTAPNKINEGGHYLESLKDLMSFLFGTLAPAATEIPNFSLEILWEGKQRPLHFWKLKRGIKVLTSDAELIGTFLVIKDLTANTELKAQFVEDELTQEGKKASAFLKKEDTDFEDLKAVYKSSKKTFHLEITRV